MILTYDLWEDLQSTWIVICLHYLSTDTLRTHVDLALIDDPSESCRGEFHDDFPATVMVNLAKHVDRADIIQTLIHECIHIQQRSTTTADLWEANYLEFDREAERIALDNFHLFM